MTQTIRRGLPILVGVLDTCGFPKDNYYYYRAWWRPDEPLVHLLPHWNWPGREGQPIEVWAHGNTDDRRTTPARLGSSGAGAPA